MWSLSCWQKEACRKYHKRDRCVSQTLCQTLISLLHSFGQIKGRKEASRASEVLTFLALSRSPVFNSLFPAIFQNMTFVRYLMCMVSVCVCVCVCMFVCMYTCVHTEAKSTFFKSLTFQKSVTLFCWGRVCSMGRLNWLASELQPFAWLHFSSGWNSGCLPSCQVFPRLWLGLNSALMNVLHWLT